MDFRRTNESTGEDRVGHNTEKGFKSTSEYLVRNPVQSALPSKKRQKAKTNLEYFWLGMTMRPEGSRNLF